MVRVQLYRECKRHDVVVIHARRSSGYDYTLYSKSLSSCQHVYGAIIRDICMVCTLARLFKRII